MNRIIDAGVEYFESYYSGEKGVCYIPIRPLTPPDYIFEPFKNCEFEVREINGEILLTLSLSSLVWWENSTKNRSINH